ncbi:MAG: hypothetical protein K6U11_00585 [bacterium]|nr:hypothetical protein [bacterium]
MNKKGFWKVLMVSLIMATAIGLMAKGAMAQILNQQVLLPDEYGALVGSGTILLDNFQYWNPPRDMGWEPIEPPYPVWGAGIGYGIMETIVDFQEGSRVLDVYCPASLFLPMNTPNYMPYTISKEAKFRAGAQKFDGIPGAYSELQFKVRAPLAIELFDTFRFIVRVRTIASNAITNGTITVQDLATGTIGGEDIPIGAHDICGNPVPTFGVADIVLMPREVQVGCTPAAIVTNPVGAAGAAIVRAQEQTVFNTQGQQVAAVPQIQATLGRQFQDGSWHVVMEDLNAILYQYSQGAEMLFEVLGVTVRGNQYRLDDIMFVNPGASIADNAAPYLFKIGPIYGQLFNTGQTRFVFAEDVDDYWLLSSQALKFKAATLPKVAEMLGKKGALNAVIAAANNDLPFVQDAAGNTMADGAAFDPTTARLVDAAGNPVTAAAYPALDFRFTVGDSLGPITSIARPVPVLPVTDITADYMRSLPVAIPAFGVPTGMWVMNNGQADASNPMYVLACALANSGYQAWPNMRVLAPSTGQVFEDMIITCRVVDRLGVADMETFPVSVVNYPVTNLPPVIEQLEDQFFQVGTQSVYQITAVDPDTFTNNLANPGAGDQLGLTYRATLNGLPSYQYGPWMEQIINPMTGTITLTPQFEGALTCIVTVTDPRGLQAVGHFTIFCVNPGTWLNHPPAVLEIIESPQIVKAGQLFTISDLRIADPDGQQLFYSCNVGSVGRNGVYSFQSEFPGEYLVQITAYDILGGAVTQQFVLQVLPWWSY